MQRSEGADERILRAVSELMGDMPFDEIAVKQVISRAGVSKGTFYYHFNGMQSVLKRMMDLFVDLISSGLENSMLVEESFKRPIPNEGWHYEQASKLFNLIDENKNLLKALLDSDYKWLFIDRLTKVFTATYAKSAHYVDDERMSLVGQIYFDYYLAFGFVSILLMWHRRGYRESPEELLNLLIASASTKDVELRREFLF